MGTELNDDLSQLSYAAKRLTDEELIARLKQCVMRGRQWDARTLIHMSEVDARKLYRDQGYSSMFAYAMRALHMSEAEAGLRITAARFGRQHPQAIAMLARGELHISAICVLASVLTHETIGLLDKARFKSKKEVEELRAKHFPKPDVATQFRQLSPRKVVPDMRSAQATRASHAPVETRHAAVEHAQVPVETRHAAVEHAQVPVANTRAAVANGHATIENADAAASKAHADLENGHAAVENARAAVENTRAAVGDGHAAVENTRAAVEDTRAAVEDTRAAVEDTRAAVEDGHAPFEHAPILAAVSDLDSPSVRSRAAASPSTSSAANHAQAFRLEPCVSRFKMVPLSEGRVSVRFTASQRWGDKLKQAQHLMRHQVPGGDPIAILERALDMLIAERKKKLFGRTDKPRRKSPKAARNEKPSRYIPVAVRREVADRDAEQCAFVAPNGRRCAERGRIELDHHPIPSARGGPSTSDNLRLLCAAHNALTAERTYGRAFIQQRITAAREASRSSRASGSQESTQNQRALGVEAVTDHVSRSSESEATTFHPAAANRAVDAVSERSTMNAEHSPECAAASGAAPSAAALNEPTLRKHRSDDAVAPSGSAPPADAVNDSTV